jgi:predicted GNAT family N-acyltransferase
MNVIYSLTENHIAQLHELYQHEWWTKGRTLEETKNCVAGSQVCVGLISANNELIGFARVLTDLTLKALIFDVIVRKDYRKTGLGDKLLSLIKSHKKLQDVKHFELYCLPEMCDFYAKHDFTTIGEIRLMRLSDEGH